VARREKSEKHRLRAESRPVVRLLQSIDVCFARIYHRLSIASPCRLPRHGPAILVSNHTSGLDPFLIQSASPRLITWMMAREYYELPGLKRVFRAIEAIPVDRTGRDLSATRAALRALSAGRILGIFPEGRIALTREILPFQTGVALMAIKSEVPVYPCYLTGDQRGLSMSKAFLLPRRAALAFGPIVSLRTANNDWETFEQGTNAIREAVLDLQKFVESRLWDDSGAAGS